LVHAVARAEELAERRRAHSANHTGLEVEKHRAGHLLAARGFVVKRADAAELRVVIAAVLDAAADAVLVAHELQKLGAHLVTALACLHVRNLAIRSSLEAGSTREEKTWKRGETLKAPCRSSARET